MAVDGERYEKKTLMCQQNEKQELENWLHPMFWFLSDLIRTFLVRMLKYNN